MAPNSTLVMVGVLLLALVLPRSARAQERTSALPDGDGKPLVEAVCAQCHSLTPLFVYRGDDRQWEIVVHEMVAFGAQVSPQERDTIMAYLKSVFSTQRAAARTTEQLPPGEGRDMIRSSCASCHGVPLIAQKRADAAEWEVLLRRHLNERRVTLSPEQTKTLLGYLVANFGRAKPAPAPNPR
jgi:mono/diheme cytochrome c family protein